MSCSCLSPSVSLHVQWQEMYPPLLVSLGECRLKQSLNQTLGSQSAGGVPIEQ
jgi:hypothetical protein